MLAGGSLDSEIEKVILDGRLVTMDANDEIYTFEMRSRKRQMQFSPFESRFIYASTDYHT